MIDYHIHTPLCNHARGDMEEYVLSAISNGIVEICFLDHLILSDYGKHNSMTLDEVPLYFGKILKLKARYKEKIEIRAGLEVDFDPDNISRIEDIIDKYAFDAIGGSIHFIDGINIASRREAERIRGKSKNALIQNYFDTLLTMLDYDYFDFICHFDVIKKTGIKISKDFDLKIDEIIEKTKEKNIAVELNTSGWDHPARECYPSLGIIRKCVDAKIPFLLSSDAHQPENVGKYFSRAMDILSSLGIQDLSVFEQKKRRVVPFARHHGL